MQRSPEEKNDQKLTIDSLQTREDELTAYQTERQNVWNKYSIVRFASAIALIVSVIGVFAQDWPWMWIAVVFFATGLVIAFRASARVARDIRLSRAKVAVIREYQARLVLDYKALSEFDTHGVLPFFSENTTRTWNDLGLTGDEGLFRYLQCLESPTSGKQLLKALIPEPEMRMANKRKDLIAGILQEPEFWLELQAHGRVSLDRVHEDPAEDETFHNRLQRSGVPHSSNKVWVDEPALDVLRKKGRGRAVWKDVISFIGRWILPSFSMLGIILLVAGTYIVELPSLIGPTVFGISGALNWLLYLTRSKDVSEDLDPLAHARTEILQAAGVFRFLENYQLVGDPLAKGTQALADKLSIYRSPNSVSEALNRLESLSQFASLRGQGIIHLFAVMWLGWDHHVHAGLESWRRANGDRIEGWYQAWAELDVANSLCVIPRVSSVWCWPEETQSMMIDMDAVKHPLLISDAAVPNSFAASDETVVITGSNMSGKSTFLRTVGISVLLAQAGAPVPGEHFRWQPMRILSSIRTEDKLSEGISAFYAEVLRIRSMREEVEERRPTMLLIDEIFHGTNSADRVFGAEQALQKLSGPNTLILVTTHDFALCDLDEDPHIQARNMHFNETYDEEGMHFDYRIKEGKSTTTNARYLLELAGLI